MTTQAEFARLRGVNRREVTRWKRDGLLVFHASGGIDVAASNAILDDRAKNPGGAAEPPSASTQDIPSLSTSRRKKEAALASMRELELARRRGELVPVADIEPVWSRIILAVRQAMLAIPGKARIVMGLDRDEAMVLTGLVRDALRTAAADES